MATPLDVIYVISFAVVLSVYDYAVSWRAARRRLQVDAARTKVRLWRANIAGQWAVVAVGAALWLYYARSWTSFGFRVPDGWRLWVSVAFVVLLAAYVASTIVTVARDPAQRAGVRKQMGDLTITDILPRTRAERDLFIGVAFTAGFCEEFLFRGYFIWVVAPWIGWWGAAAASLLLFAAWHAYQGWNGVLRTGIVGALCTIVVAVFGSLWPAIALHVLVDIQGGVIAWLALRDGPTHELPAPGR
jgi:membrane protease YdiL (CAAX protease family)